VGLVLGVAVAAAAALIGWWAAGFDQPVYRSLVEHRSPMLTTVMKAVSQAGSPGAMVVLALVVTALLFRRTGQWSVALIPLVSAAVGTAAEVSLKRVVARSRPPIVNRLVPESGRSFPSGHATVSAALLAAVFLIAPRLVPARFVLVVRVLAVLAVVAVGLSRLYLGVHYPLDVLAGWVIGAAIAALVVAVSRLATRARVR